MSRGCRSRSDGGAAFAWLGPSSISFGARDRLNLYRRAGGIPVCPSVASVQLRMHVFGMAGSIDRNDDGCTSSGECDGSHNCEIFDLSKTLECWLSPSPDVDFFLVFGVVV